MKIRFVDKDHWEVSTNGTLVASGTYYRDKIPEVQRYHITGSTHPVMDGLFQALRLFRVFRKKASKRCLSK
jgi:hypothetical protein